MRRSPADQSWSAAGGDAVRAARGACAAGPDGQREQRCRDEERERTTHGAVSTRCLPSHDRLLSFEIEPEGRVDAHDAELCPSCSGSHRLRRRALVEEEAGVVLGHEDGAEEAHVLALAAHLLGRLPGPGRRLLELRQPVSGRRSSTV